MTTKNKDHYISLVNSQMWGIVPSYLDTIRAAVEKIDFDAYHEETLKQKSYMKVNADGIAVIQIMGPIMQRPGFFDMLFGGGASSEALIADLERAVESPSVKAILLYIDSPGGQVNGTKDVADMVGMVNQVKPVIAFTDGILASAAYWIGSAGNKVFATPTSKTGSVGILAMHVDYSKADEEHGIKRTIVFNGRYKGLVSDTEPLSKEGQEYMQELVDQTYAIFVNDVAKARGMTPKAVYEHESKIFLAAAAKEAGLIDQVGSFNDAYTALKRRAGLMNLTEFQTEHNALFQEVKILGVESATVKELAEHHMDKIEAWRKEGQETERTRISEIREAAFDGQDVLVAQLVKDGVAVDDARKQLMANQKETMAGSLNALKAGDIGDLGANASEEDRIAVKAKADKAKADLEAGDQETATDKTDAGNKLDAFAKEIMADKDYSYGKALNAAMVKYPKIAEVYNGK